VDQRLATPPPEPSDLSQVLRPVWSRKWLILALVLVATGLTYRHYDSQPREYRASTTIYVQTSELEQSLFGTALVASDDRTTANQAELMTSSSVVRQAAHDTGFQGDPRVLLGGLSVVPRSGEDFIDVSYVATDPRRAALLANGFVQAFILIRSNELRGKVTQAQKAAERELATTPSSPINQAARSQIASRVRQLQVVADLPSGNAEQIDRASPPASPFSPRPARNALFAAVLALFLGVAAAFGLNRFDRRIRTIEDLESAYGVAVLGALPRVSETSSSDEGRAVMPGPFREPCRSLRTSVELAALDRNLKVLLVISAVSGEGKSTVVRNLALAYAEAGLRVVIVEGDVRRPIQTEMLNAGPGPGLTNVLAQELPLSDAVRSVPYGSKRSVAESLPARVPDVASGGVSLAETNGAHEGGLWLLSSGPEPPNPPVVLGSERMSSMLDELREQFDIVLVDSAPLLVVSDAVPLIGNADGTIIIGRLNETFRDATRRVRDVVARIPDANILGVVANEVSSRDYATGYRYYGYGRTRRRLLRRRR
jgi:polysaccharide biosynthesis transport protein